MQKLSLRTQLGKQVIKRREYCSSLCPHGDPFICHNGLSRYMADAGLSKIIGLKTDQNIGKRQWGGPRNTGEKGVIISGVPQQHACRITLKDRISSTYLAHSILFFFLMWTIFKVFSEFLSILLLFHVLVFWPRGKWDLSSPARDRTGNPGTGRQNLNHSSTRKSLSTLFCWCLLAPRASSFLPK